MNNFWIIIDEYGLIYNGGYSYENTKEIFTEDYNMFFSSEKDAIESLKSIIDKCEYAEIRKIYIAKEK